MAAACAWADAARDRETCLRLLFLEWYAQAEPPFVTGDIATSGPGLVRDLVLDLRSRASPGDGLAFVLSVMIEIADWVFDEETRQLVTPAAAIPDSAVFAGHGAYGR